MSRFSKRARSAYNFFVAEQRAVIKAKHPDLDFRAITCAVAQAWKNRDKETRAHYDGLAAAERARRLRGRRDGRRRAGAALRLRDGHRALVAARAAWHRGHERDLYTLTARQ